MILGVLLGYRVLKITTKFSRTMGKNKPKIAARRCEMHIDAPGQVIVYF